MDDTQQTDSEPGGDALTSLSGLLRLTITRKIASGGMGAVYRAMQHGAEGFSKTVAIKTILESYSGSDDFKKMFIGEAKLVADLVHQNIVQVYQLGRDRGLLYIVMEHVDGVNLGQFNQRHRGHNRRLPLELAAYITSRICRGLEYAHNKRGRDGQHLALVHRDISPSNLMITELGEIKILDFGIAKAHDVVFRHDDRIVLGKRAYVSPEQAALGSVDRRADVFATGLILWELIAGQSVVTIHGDGRRSAEQYRVPVAPITDFAAETPQMLAGIVDKATRIDPAERYDDAGKMGYDLEYFMYHKGYGPTIVTMENYLRDVFPDKPWLKNHPGADDELDDTQVLDPPPGSQDDTKSTP